MAVLAQVARLRRKMMADVRQSASFPLIPCTVVTNYRLVRSVLAAYAGFRISISRALVPKNLYVELNNAIYNTTRLYREV